LSSKIHEIQGYIQTIYLVEENGEFLLLDGCCRPDVEVIQDYIENKLHKSIYDLKLVISTHAHPDHMGALSEFKKLGITIAGPRDLNSWYQGISGLFTYFTDILLTYLIAFNKKRRFKNIFFQRKVELDYVLVDNQVIPGFENWKALECPGHTNQDLTIYNESQSIAYVGDNFVGSKRNVFTPYPVHLPELYKSSLQRYIDLDIKEFLLAHYGRVEISKARIKELVESSSTESRRHINSLHSILFKLLKSLLKY
jgi:glyoxylase-like metal-dependent hydrolase (beta-lactamase superfamily II)